MKKTYICLLITLMATLLTTGTANAAITQIVLGSSDNNITFTNNGANSASISFGTLTGTGTFEPSNVQGTYTMSLSGGTPTLGSPTSSAYPVNMNGATINFTFSISGSALAGNIVLNTVYDTDGAPQILATLNTTSSSGQFTSLWPSGSSTSLDFALDLYGSPTVGKVYAGTNSSTSGTISSGQAVPVPEPASIALLGSGLLMVGSLTKNRRKK
jgi:hypothetical protein